MEIKEYERNRLDVYLPFSFINKSNMAGSVIDVRISLSPTDSDIIQLDTSLKIDAHWNEIWFKASEVVDSTGRKKLVNRPLHQTHIITLIGNSAEYQYVNFYPLRSKFRLEEGRYFIEVSILTDYKSEWISKEYYFDYEVMNKSKAYLVEL